MSRVTSMSRAAARPTVVLAALAAIALSLAYLIQPAGAVATTDIHLKASQQGSDSTTFENGSDCGTFGSVGTKVVWHFVLNNFDPNTPAGDLTAQFQTAADQSTTSSKVLSNVQHFYVATPSDDVLDDAWATIQLMNGQADAQLVLSHVCHQQPAGYASIFVRKNDDNWNHLPGAVFEVTSEDGQEVIGQFTTDAEGSFCVIDLPQNASYWITEIQAPDGYIIQDPAAVLVHVDNDGDCTSRDVLFVDTPMQSTPEESVQESTSESVAESVPESVAESVPESVAESVPESVAESVPESVAESVEQSVQESTSESVPESAPESVPQSAEQSVAGATGTPEQSVAGATGTPQASLPNGAMGQGDGPSPLPTVLFSLILLISLGTLAYVNVRTVRNRS